MSGRRTEKNNYPFQTQGWAGPNFLLSGGSNPDDIYFSTFFRKQKWEQLLKSLPEVLGGRLCVFISLQPDYFGGICGGCDRDHVL